MKINREENIARTELFERMPIHRAVMKLAIPTIASSLVMVLYNLADTYFVGMLGDAVQNAAVTLAAPVLLAFNAVNNLFGVGSSSMMSRALGRKDEDTVRRSSAFGFYFALASGVLFSVLCTAFMQPLLTTLGADAQTAEATWGYLKWTVSFGAAPSILNVVLAYLVRAGRGGRRPGDVPVQLLRLPVFLRAALRAPGEDLRLRLAPDARPQALHRAGRVRGGHPRLHPEPAQRHGHDRAQ